MTTTMTSKHAFDYGNPEVAKITINKLFDLAGLSEVDREIMLLRYGHEWQMDEIARAIGEKYYNRPSDSPLWEGTIRYRIKIILKSLRKIIDNKDFFSENAL